VKSYTFIDNNGDITKGGSPFKMEGS